MRLSIHIAACACFLVALSAFPSSSLAAPTYRVVINSKPAGASVWIDERSGEPAGQTPYEARLPEGTHTVFLELDGHEFAVHEVTVEQRKKGVQRFSFELTELSYGSLDVIAASGSATADGARVLIDGKEVGTVPDTFEVTEGAHQVEVVKDGFRRFEQWVEVVKGQSLEVSVALESLTGGSGDDKDPEQPVVPVISDTPADTGPKQDLLVLEAGLGSGWRRFEYDQPRTNNLRPYSASGIALVDVGAELRLGRLIRSLRWLSIFGGASLSLPLTSSTADGNEEIATTWLRREVGVRARVAMGPAWIGLDVAEGGNSFTFENDPLLDGEIPEAVYEYVRAGATVGVMAGANTIGAGADGLFVISSAGLTDYFGDSSILGMRFHGWYKRRVMPSIEASLTGSFTQFSYTLEAGAQHDADGGTDRMIDVVLAAAYRF